jgi:hypothetical protein
MGQQNSTLSPPQLPIPFMSGGSTIILKKLLKNNKILKRKSLNGYQQLLFLL